MGVKKSEKDLDAYADRLLLDIKALVLLKGSEGELRQLLDAKLLNSHDEEVRQFLKLLKPQERGRSMVISTIAEIALSALLAFSGVLLVMPVLADISTPALFAAYFETISQLASSKPNLYPATLVLNFAVALFLIVGAAALLRRSARELREAGFEAVEE